MHINAISHINRRCFTLNNIYKPILSHHIKMNKAFNGITITLPLSNNAFAVIYSKRQIKCIKIKSM